MIWHRDIDNTSTWDMQFVHIYIFIFITQKDYFWRHYIILFRTFWRCASESHFWVTTSKWQGWRLSHVACVTLLCSSYKFCRHRLFVPYIRYSSPRDHAWLGHSCRTLDTASLTKQISTLLRPLRTLKNHDWCL